MTRQQTHGNFLDTARVSQNLKHIVRDDVGYDVWMSLTPAQREAIDGIFVKISRIMSGGGHKEHWEGIVGYGQLGLESCPS